MTKREQTLNEINALYAVLKEIQDDFRLLDKKNQLSGNLTEKETAQHQLMEHLLNVYERNH